MLKNVTDYHYPGSLDEATSLHDRESRSFFIAGGTALALSDSSRPVELIDISRLDLDGLEVDRKNGRITIGAVTKIQDVVESEAIKSVLGGFLGDSLEEIGSYPIRNAGTLGGSLVRPFPWSDVIPILSVLDTEIYYYHEGETDSRNISSLYDSDFRSTLNNAVIEKIVINLPETGKTAATFSKFNRSEFDVAALNLGCSITVNESRITEAKLSAGARPMTGKRISDVEEALIGEKLTVEVAKEGGELAGDKTPVRGDNKLSEEYRKELIEKMTEDAIREIINEVANEN